MEINATLDKVIMAAALSHNAFLPMVRYAPKRSGYIVYVGDLRAKIGYRAARRMALSGLGLLGPPTTKKGTVRVNSDISTLAQALRNEARDLRYALQQRGVA